MKKCPEWVDTVLIFIAGIFLTGAVWFYFSKNSLWGEIISIFLGVIFFALYIILHIKREKDKREDEIIRRNQTESKRIELLKTNLDNRIKTDASARELTDIALTATDVISLEIIDILWNCIQKNSNRNSIVNQCVFSIGRIVTEQSSVNIIRRNKVMECFIKSCESNIKIIIDCFAYTSQKIVDEPDCDKEIRNEYFNFIKKQCSHLNPVVNKIYKDIWKKIKNLDAFFVAN